MRKCGISRVFAVFKEGLDVVGEECAAVEQSEGSVVARFVADCCQEGLG